MCEGWWRSTISPAAEARRQVGPPRRVVVPAQYEKRAKCRWSPVWSGPLTTAIPLGRLVPASGAKLTGLMPFPTTGPGPGRPLPVGRDARVVPGLAQLHPPRVEAERVALAEPGALGHPVPRPDRRTAPHGADLHVPLQPRAAAPPGGGVGAVLCVVPKWLESG